MIYILDSNFLIDAWRVHFPIPEHPEFWRWLGSLAQKEIIAIPAQVYDEVAKGQDVLSVWLEANKTGFVHEVPEYIQAISEALQAYGKIDEATLDILKADPWVIAHAVAVKGAVVTSEKPNKAISPHNKKIPSICEALNIPCLTFSRFMWEVRRTMPS
jgi:hypothetical protein